MQIDDCNVTQEGNTEDEGRETQVEKKIHFLSAGPGRQACREK